MFASSSRASTASFLAAARSKNFTRAMNTDSGRSEGAVREAGGAFSKKEKAHEDQFFQKKQQEQLKNLKDAHKDEIKHHKEEIERHKQAIKHHEDKMKDLK